MKNSFCTIVDKNFVIKGLTLYNSLLRQNMDFVFWTLCMDDESYDIFTKLKLKNLVVIKFSDFENERLKEIKKERTLAEYCWTCVSFFCLHLLKKYVEIETLVYLDSDLYFFSSLKKIFKQFDGFSFLLTPHRDGLSKIESIKGAGIYNAGFFVVRNDVFGIERLEDWGEKCLKSCFNCMGKGLYAGQWYLNDWPDKYKKVFVLEDKGVNAAVWNIFRYKVLKKEKNVCIDNDKLIVYHFSRFDIVSKNSFRYNIDRFGYEVPKNVLNLIYKPYSLAIRQSIKQIEMVDSKFKFGISKKTLLEKIFKKKRKG